MIRRLIDYLEPFAVPTMLAIATIAAFGLLALGVSQAARIASEMQAEVAE